MSDPCLDRFRVKSGVTVSGIAALIISGLIILVCLGVIANGAITARKAPTTAPCLVEVPGNATINPFGNSSTVGNYVSFTNGTTLYFPQNRCPQPVSPQQFVLDSAIERDPRFLLAEHGSIYYAEQGIAGYEEVGTSDAVLTFTEYSNNLTAFCGGNLWLLTELGQIQVSVAEENNGNSYDFSNMSVSVVSNYELNVVNCNPGAPAQTTTTPTGESVSLPHGLVLCASLCGSNDVPYLSGIVLVNSMTPSKVLQLCKVKWGISF